MRLATSTMRWELKRDTSAGHTYFASFSRNWVNITNNSYMCTPDPRNTNADPNPRTLLGSISNTAIPGGNPQLMNKNRLELVLVSLGKRSQP